METYITKIPQIMFVTNPKNKINIDIGTASTLFNMVSKRVFEEKSNPKLFGAFVVSNDSKKIDDIVVSWYCNEYKFNYELFHGEEKDGDAEIIKNKVIQFLSISSIENGIFNFSDNNKNYDQVSKFMIESKNESGIIEIIIDEGNNERIYTIKYSFHNDNIDSSKEKIEELISEVDDDIIPNFHSVNKQAKIIH